MTVTNLQTSWPCTVNTWAYPQLLPVGLNLDGLEQDVIETGFSIDRPDHYQGLDVPAGHRLATVVEWVFQIEVNSKADKAFLFIQGEPSWTVTSSEPVADDGSGNFGIGCTSMSPPAGPGLPTGATTIVVTPDSATEVAQANYGGFPGLFGFGRWHFTAGGCNSDFTVPDDAEFVFSSLTVEYTTEVDPFQAVWNAIEAGDGFVAPAGPDDRWVLDIADPGSIPQPVPCDIDAGEGRWVMIDVDVGDAGTMIVLQGSIIFEDTPDEANAICQASSPIFDVGVPGSMTFVGAVEQRGHWFVRSPQNLIGPTRALLSFPTGMPITRLDVWYERQLDPPVALFTAIPDTGPSPLLVNFDASASFDPTTVCWPLLGIVSWEWDFNYDGFTFVPSTDAEITSHLYTIPGTYEVALLVTDGDGQTDMAFATITVGAAGRWKIGQIGMGVPS